MSKKTPFYHIYDKFLDRVTSEMYMEMTELDTLEALQGILENAIPRFEFPRCNIFDYEVGFMHDLGMYQGVESNNEIVPATGWVGGFFNVELTEEEENILAMCMLIEWLIQQLNTTENTRMIYTGSDFKMSSQANHMAKLKLIIQTAKEDCLHLQRVYKRRRMTAGGTQSTFGQIMEKPTYGYKI